MIKAILFDLDGTLINSTEYIFRAFEYTLKAHGQKPVPRSKIRRRIGRALTDTYQFLTELKDVQDLFNTHRDFQGKNLKLIKSYSSVKETIQKLHEQRYKLAVITSRWSYIKETLEIAGIKASQFELIVGASDVQNHKPHPEPVNVVLQKLKISSDEAVMVGDGIADIEAAKAAGVKSIAVTYGFGYKKDLRAAGADYLVDSFKELPGLVKSI